MSLRHAAVPGAAAIPRQAPPPLAARRRMVAAQQSSGRASAASTLEHQVTEDSAPAMNTRVDDQYKSFLDNWDRGFVDTEEEPEGYWMEAEFGQIPMDLHGTLFRCVRGEEAKLRCTMCGYPMAMLYSEHVIQRGSKLTGPQLTGPPSTLLRTGCAGMAPGSSRLAPTRWVTPMMGTGWSWQSPSTTDRPSSGHALCGRQSTSRRARSSASCSGEHLARSGRAALRRTPWMWW